jgi:hypothetical protein
VGGVEAARGVGNRESDGYDREHLLLPQDQAELIRAVAHAARRSVVVLLNGGVVSLEGWHDEVDAVIEAWLPARSAVALSPTYSSARSTPPADWPRPSRSGR